MKVTLPPLFRINAKENGSAIRQLTTPSLNLEATVESLQHGRARGFTIVPADGTSTVRLLTNASHPNAEWTHALRLRGLQFDHTVATTLDLSDAGWVTHPDEKPQLSGMAAGMLGAETTHGVGLPARRLAGSLAAAP